MTAFLNKGIQLNCNTEAVLEKHTTDTGKTVHHNCATNKNTTNAQVRPGAKGVDRAPLNS